MAETTSKPRSSGIVVAYQILAIITTLVIILQFFLAGLGTFHDFQTGKTDGFEAHEAVGYIIAGLGVLLLVLAAVGRLGTRVIVMGAVMFLLAGPVQALLANAGTEHSDVWGALHALVGALIVGLVFSILRVGRS